MNARSAEARYYLGMIALRKGPSHEEEARQKFARNTSMGNPMNIKTLAQFNLYGDPSCSPVKMVDPKGPLPKTPAKGISYATVDRVDRVRS